MQRHQLDELRKLIKSSLSRLTDRKQMVDNTKMINFMELFFSVRNNNIFIKFESRSRKVKIKMRFDLGFFSLYIFTILRIYNSSLIGIIHVHISAGILSLLVLC